MKKRKGNILRLITVGIVTGAIALGTAWATIRLRSEQTGINAVKYMYDFKDAYQLDRQMSDLKEITTEQVFDSLTIDNQDRTLNTYLKFKQNPVSVEIIKSAPNYVLYRLKTDSLTGNRKFMMTFETNLLGKIDYVREMEIIDFVPNLD